MGSAGLASGMDATHMHSAIRRQIADSLANLKNRMLDCPDFRVVGSACAQINRAFTAKQTYALDSWGEKRIDKALLDRFLACMKPAS
ncbi:hypothetical protein QPR87_22405 [Paracoccus sp. SSJ]|jgi:hypothetical protein|nr:hypothetical protein [Paracoccus sp. SSJ]GEK70891.1 hypothetical protein PDE01_44110 [Paracoccus denitrificans]